MRCDETKDTVVVGSRIDSRLAQSRCGSVSCQLVKHAFRTYEKEEKKGENGGAGRERSDCFELKQRDKFFNESISRDRTSGRSRTLRQIHACFLSGGY